jgi:hypothetical protein
VSGELSATPNLPFIEVLDAAECGQLDGLDLPDIRQSPFDTTFSDGTSRDIVPLDVRDVREIILPNTFPEWRDDTLVRATISFRLNKRRGNLEAIAETIDPAYDHAVPQVLAVFMLGRLGLGEYPADELEQITLLGFRRLIADLRITNIRQDPLEPRLPRNQYAAIVGDVYALERPFDGDFDTLVNREPVLLEGTVEAYEPGGHSTHLPANVPGIIIRQADGQIVGARILQTNELRYGGSTIGAGGSDTEPVPPYPLPGDKAQVIALHSRSYNGSSLIVRGYYGAFLLDASDERIQDSLAAQQQLEQLMDIVRSTSDLVRIRKLIGNHIAGLLRVKNGEVIFDLPAAHRNQLVAAVNAENPHSEEAAKQRPMGLVLQKDPAYYLMKAFGDEILMMSPSEFSAFMLEVARGERPTTSQEAGIHVYQFCRYDQSMQAIDFVTATLGDFFERYTMERLVVAENQERDAYAGFMMKRAIETLQVIQNQDKIAALLIRLMRDTFSDDPALPDLCDVLPNALLQSVARCGAWDFNLFSDYSHNSLRRGEALGIVYDDAYQMYLEAAPAIIEAVECVNQTTSHYDGQKKLQTAYGDFLVLFISTLDKLAKVAGR